MFGKGHLFGRRAGLREFGNPAELRRRKFIVKPLQKGPHQCDPIEGQLSHWRTDGKTKVTYTCGDRTWEVFMPPHSEIEDALKTAKEAARYWRGVMQSGEKVPQTPKWPLSRRS